MAETALSAELEEESFTQMLERHQTLLSQQCHVPHLTITADTTSSSSDASTPDTTFEQKMRITRTQLEERRIYLEKMAKCEKLYKESTQSLNELLEEMEGNCDELERFVGQNVRELKDHLRDIEDITDELDRRSTVMDDYNDACAELRDHLAESKRTSLDSTSKLVIQRWNGVNGRIHERRKFVQSCIQYLSRFEDLSPRLELTNDKLMDKLADISHDISSKNELTQRQETVKTYQREVQSLRSVKDVCQKLNQLLLPQQTDLVTRARYAETTYAILCDRVEEERQSIEHQLELHHELEKLVLKQKMALNDVERKMDRCKVKKGDKPVVVSKEAAKLKGHIRALDQQGRQMQGRLQTLVRPTVRLPDNLAAQLQGLKAQRTETRNRVQKKLMELEGIESVEELVAEEVEEEKKTLEELCQRVEGWGVHPETKRLDVTPQIVDTITELNRVCETVCPKMQRESERKALVGRVSDLCGRTTQVMESPASRPCLRRSEVTEWLDQAECLLRRPFDWSSCDGLSKQLNEYQALLSSAPDVTSLDATRPGDADQERLVSDLATDVTFTGKQLQDRIDRLNILTSSIAHNQRKMEDINLWCERGKQQLREIVYSGSDYHRKVAALEKMVTELDDRRNQLSQIPEKDPQIIPLLRHQHETVTNQLAQIRYDVIECCDVIRTSVRHETSGGHHAEVPKEYATEGLRKFNFVQADCISYGIVKQFKNKHVFVTKHLEEATPVRINGGEQRVAKEYEQWIVHKGDKLEVDEKGLEIPKDTSFVLRCGRPDLDLKDTFYLVKPSTKVFLNDEKSQLGTRAYPGDRIRFNKVKVECDSAETCIVLNQKTDEEAMDRLVAQKITDINTVLIEPGTKIKVTGQTVTVERGDTVILRPNQTVQIGKSSHAARAGQLLIVHCEPNYIHEAITCLVEPTHAINISGWPKTVASRETVIIRSGETVQIDDTMVPVQKGQVVLVIGRPNYVLPLDDARTSLASALGRAKTRAGEDLDQSPSKKLKAEELPHTEHWETEMVCRRLSLERHEVSASELNVSFEDTFVGHIERLNESTDQAVSFGSRVEPVEDIEKTIRPPEVVEYHPCCDHDETTIAGARPRMMKVGEMYTLVVTTREDEVIDQDTEMVSPERFENSMEIDLSKSDSDSDLDLGDVGMTRRRSSDDDRMDESKSGKRPHFILSGPMQGSSASETESLNNSREEVVPRKVAKLETELSRNIPEPLASKQPVLINLGSMPGKLRLDGTQGVGIDHEEDSLTLSPRGNAYRGLRGMLQHQPTDSDVTEEVMTEETEDTLPDGSLIYKRTVTTVVDSVVVDTVTVAGKAVPTECATDSSGYEDHDDKTEPAISTEPLSLLLETGDGTSPLPVQQDDCVLLLPGDSIATEDLTIDVPQNQCLVLRGRTLYKSIVLTIPPGQTISWPGQKPHVIKTETVIIVCVRTTITVTRTSVRIKGSSQVIDALNVIEVQPSDTMSINECPIPTDTSFIVDVPENLHQLIKDLPSCDKSIPLASIDNNLYFDTIPSQMTTLLEYCPIQMAHENMSAEMNAPVMSPPLFTSSAVEDPSRGTSTPSSDTSETSSITDSESSVKRAPKKRRRSSPLTSETSSYTSSSSDSENDSGQDRKPSTTSEEDLTTVVETQRSTTPSPVDEVASLSSSQEQEGMQKLAKDPSSTLEIDVVQPDSVSVTASQEMNLPLVQDTKLDSVLSPDSAIDLMSPDSISQPLDEQANVLETMSPDSEQNLEKMEDQELASVEKPTDHQMEPPKKRPKSTSTMSTVSTVSSDMTEDTSSHSSSSSSDSDLSDSESCASSKTSGKPSKGRPSNASSIPLSEKDIPEEVEDDEVKSKGEETLPEEQELEDTLKADDLQNAIQQSLAGDTTPPEAILADRDLQHEPSVDTKSDSRRSSTSSESSSSSSSSSGTSVTSSSVSQSTTNTESKTGTSLSKRSEPSLATVEEPMRELDIEEESPETLIQKMLESTRRPSETLSRPDIQDKDGWESTRRASETPSKSDILDKEEVLPITEETKEELKKEELTENTGLPESPSMNEELRKEELSETMAAPESISVHEEQAKEWTEAVPTSESLRLQEKLAEGVPEETVEIPGSPREVSTMDGALDSSVTGKGLDALHSPLTDTLVVKTEPIAETTDSFESEEDGSKIHTDVLSTDHIELEVTKSVPVTFERQPRVEVFNRDFEPTEYKTNEALDEKTPDGTALKKRIETIDTSHKITVGIKSELASDDDEDKAVDSDGLLSGSASEADIEKYLNEVKSLASSCQDLDRDDEPGVQEADASEFPTKSTQQLHSENVDPSGQDSTSVSVEVSPESMMLESRPISGIQMQQDAMSDSTIPNQSDRVPEDGNKGAQQTPDDVEAEDRLADPDTEERTGNIRFAGSVVESFPSSLRANEEKSSTNDDDRPAPSALDQNEPSSDQSCDHTPMDTNRHTTTSLNHDQEDGLLPPSQDNEDESSFQKPTNAPELQNSQPTDADEGVTMVPPYQESNRESTDGNDTAMLDSQEADSPVTRDNKAEEGKTQMPSESLEKESCTPVSSIADQEQILHPPTKDSNDPDATESDQALAEQPATDVYSLAFQDDKADQNIGQDPSALLESVEAQPTSPRPEDLAITPPSRELKDPSADLSTDPTEEQISTDSTSAELEAGPSVLNLDEEWSEKPSSTTEDDSEYQYGSKSDPDANDDPGLTLDVTNFDVTKDSTMSSSPTSSDSVTGSSSSSEDEQDRPVGETIDTGALYATEAGYASDEMSSSTAAQDSPKKTMPKQESIDVMAPSAPKRDEPPATCLYVPTGKPSEPYLISELDSEDFALLLPGDSVTIAGDSIQIPRNELRLLHDRQLMNVTEIPVRPGESVQIYGDDKTLTNDQRILLFSDVPQDSIMASTGDAVSVSGNPVVISSDSAIKFVPGDEIGVDGKLMSLPAGPVVLTGRIPPELSLPRQMSDSVSESGELADVESEAVDEKLPMKLPLLTTETVDDVFGMNQAVDEIQPTVMQTAESSPGSLAPGMTPSGRRMEDRRLSPLMTRKAVEQALDEMDQECLSGSDDEFFKPIDKSATTGHLALEPRRSDFGLESEITTAAVMGSEMYTTDQDQDDVEPERMADERDDEPKYRLLHPGDAYTIGKVHHDIPAGEYKLVDMKKNEVRPVRRVEVPINSNIAIPGSEVCLCENDYVVVMSAGTGSGTETAKPGEGIQLEGGEEISDPTKCVLLDDDASIVVDNELVKPSPGEVVMYASIHMDFDVLRRDIVTSESKDFVESETDDGIPANVDRTVTSTDTLTVKRIQKPLETPSKTVDVDQDSHGPEKEKDTTTSEKVLADQTLASETITTETETSTLTLGISCLDRDTESPVSVPWDLEDSSEPVDTIADLKVIPGMVQEINDEYKTEIDALNSIDRTDPEVTTHKISEDFAASAPDSEDVDDGRRSPTSGVQDIDEDVTAPTLDAQEMAENVTAPKTGSDVGSQELDKGVTAPIRNSQELGDDVTIPRTGSQEMSDEVSALLPESQELSDDVTVPTPGSQELNDVLTGLTPVPQELGDDVTAVTPDSQELVDDVTGLTPDSQELGDDVTAVTAVSQELGDDVTALTPGSQELGDDVTGLTPGSQELDDDVTGLTPGSQELDDDVTGLTPGSQEFVDDVTGLTPGSQELGDDVTGLTPGSQEPDDDVTGLTLGSQELGDDVTASTPGSQELDDDVTALTPGSQELGDDVTSLTPVSQELGDDVTAVTPVSQELGDDVTALTPGLQELGDDVTASTPGSQELDDDVTAPAPVSQELGDDVTALTPGSQELGDDVTAVTPVSQEVGDDVTALTPGSQELGDDVTAVTPVSQELGDDGTGLTPGSQELDDDVTAVTPVSQELGDDVTALTPGSQELGDDVTGLTPGLQELGDNVTGLTPGSQELGDDVIGLTPGSQELGDDVTALTPGSQELGDDVTALTPGSQELGDDVTALTPGSQELGDDVTGLTPGSQELGDDVTASTPGSQELDDDVTDLTPVSQELDDDVSALTPVSQELGDDVTGLTPVSLDLGDDVTAVTPVSQELGDDVTALTPGSQELGDDVTGLTPVSQELGDVVTAVPPVSQELGDDVIAVPPVSQELGDDVTALTPGSQELGDVVTAVPPVSQELGDDVTALTPGSQELGDDVTASTPGSQELDDDVTALTPGLQGLDDDVTALTPSSQELDDDVTGLSPGSQELGDDVTAVTPGLQELGDDVTASKPGSQELGDDVTALTPGSQELDDDVTALTPGSQELGNDVTAVTPGSQELGDDVTGLTPGSQELGDDVTALAPGSQELGNDVTAVTPGSQELGDDVTGLTPGSQELGDDVTALTPGSQELGNDVTAVTPVSQELGDDVTALAPGSHELGYDVTGLTSVSQELGDDVTAVTPVSQELGDDVTALTPGLQELGDDVTALTPGSQELDDDVTALTPGSQELGDDVTAVTPVSQELGDDVTALTPGSQELDDDVTALTPGSQELGDDVTGLTPVSLELEDDVTASTPGSQELDDDDTDLTPGSQELDDDVTALRPGSQELGDDVTALTPGSQELDDDVTGLTPGSQELDDDVTGLTPGSQELDDDVMAVRPVSQELGDGVTAPAPVSQELSDDVTALTPGSQELGDDVTALTLGSQELGDDVTVLTPGSQELDDDVTALSPGSQDMCDDVTALMAGSQELGEDVTVTKPGSQELGDDVTALTPGSRELGDDVTAVTPGSQEMGDDVTALTPGSQELGDNVTALTPGSQEMGGDVTALTPGSQELGDDVTALTSGSQELGDDVTALTPGSQELGDDVTTLTLGSQEMGDDVTALTPGSEEMGDNVTALTPGSQELGDDVTALTPGSQELGDDVTALTPGSQELGDDVTTLTLGSQEMGDDVTALTPGSEEMGDNVTALTPGSQEISVEFNVSKSVSQEFLDAPEKLLPSDSDEFDEKADRESTEKDTVPTTDKDETFQEAIDSKPTFPEAPSQILDDRHDHDLRHAQARTDLRKDSDSESENEFEDAEDTPLDDKVPEEVEEAPEERPPTAPGEERPEKPVDAEDVPERPATAPGAEQEEQGSDNRQKLYEQAVDDASLSLRQAENLLDDVTINRMTSQEPNQQTLKESERQKQESPDQRAMIALDRARDDVKHLHDVTEQLTSSPDGQKAVDATVGMLDTKLNQAEVAAQAKQNEIDALESQKKRNQQDLSDFEKSMTEFTRWLAKSEQIVGAIPEPGDEKTLKKYLDDNQKIQSELPSRTAQLEDLSLVSDRLADCLPANQKRAMLQRVQDLRRRLDSLRQAADQQASDITAHLTSLETREPPRIEGVGAPGTPGAPSRPQYLRPVSQDAMQQLHKCAEEQANLQKKLNDDLKQHHKVLRSISHPASDADQAPSSPGHAPLSPGHAPADADSAHQANMDEVFRNWRRLQAQMENRKLELEETIMTSPRGEYRVQERRPSQFGLESHTNDRLQDVRQALIDMRREWERLQEHSGSSERVRLESALAFQRQYGTVLSTISAWLDSVELALFGSMYQPQIDPARQQGLRSEIQGLRAEIEQMTVTSQSMVLDANTDLHDLMKKAIGELTARMTSLEQEAGDKEDRMHDMWKEWKLYQEELQRFHTMLENARHEFLSTVHTSSNIDQQVASSQALEKLLTNYEPTMDALCQRGEELTEQDHHFMMPIDITMLKMAWTELQQRLLDHRSTLNRRITLQSQYERMLQEYAEFLETAQNKLQSNMITANSSRRLQEQADTHKLFFSDLESHRTMLDALSHQVDRATHQKYLTAHTRLINLTHIIQDRACLRGQQLDHLVSVWLEFDQKFAYIRTWLTTVEVDSPLNLPESSRAEIETKIEKLRRLQNQLHDEKANMYQVLDKGRQILHAVTCPDLENQLAEFAEKWMNVTNSANHQLKRLETSLDQYTRFQDLHGLLHAWIVTAPTHLRQITTLSEKDRASLANVRNKIDDYLIFRKEVEEKADMKSRMQATSHQLSRLAEYPDVLDQSASLDNQWTELCDLMNQSEDSLLNAQMDLLPARQALKELFAWMEEQDKVIAEDENKVPETGQEAKDMVAKYKNLKIELLCREPVVEFVNQAVLQTNILEGDNAQQERTYLAERLGDMNARWQRLSSDVLEALKMYELHVTKWDECERTVSSFVSWCREQEARVARYRRMGHEVSVRHASKECKSIEDQLKTKEAEIDVVRKLGITLSEGISDNKKTPVGLRGIDAYVGRMQQAWSQLDQNVLHVQQKQDEVLDHWDGYAVSTNQVTRLMNETEYTLARYSTVTGDVDSFRTVVEKLKKLLTDYEQSGDLLNTYLDNVESLTRLSEHSVGESLSDAAKGSQERWDTLLTSLRSRIAEHEDILQTWTQYNDKYADMKTFLDELEQAVSVIRLHTEESETKQQNLDKCKSLLMSFDEHQQTMDELSSLSDHLTSYMDNTTIIFLASQETSLNQQLNSLKHSLGSYSSRLHKQVTQLTSFDQSIDALKVFLNKAENALNLSGTPRSRFDELKHLLKQFTNNQGKIDSLNELACRLALTEEQTEGLAAVNDKWTDLMKKVTEKYKEVQGTLLQEQNFMDKCAEWLELMGQMEKDLATDIATNHDDLQKQQVMFEIFLSEIYSRQQILHSIIKDGTQMLSHGQVETPSEFQTNLNQLDSQWQSVVKRANQRKAIIDQRVIQWDSFKLLASKLCDWLVLLSENMRVFEFSVAPMQKLKSLLDHTKDIQREMDLHQTMYQRVQEAGGLLIEQSDAQAAQRVRDSLAKIQQGWFQVLGKLEAHRENLESILAEWDRCERGIDDCLQWLRYVRRSLSQNLPSSYDQLLRELRKCEDYEASFVTKEEKMTLVADSERHLSLIITSEDLTILRQRIVLLDKQWHEISNQVGIRKQRIQDSLSEWSSFNERYKELCDWLTSMEHKVSSNRQYQIEDLLVKLQRDYTEELEDMRMNKDAVVEQGERLIGASSHVRAKDINAKLEYLQERWTQLEQFCTSRQRKLQETLMAVSQLEQNMASLRQWLTQTEHRLGGPVVYQHATRQEIQDRLLEQEETEREVNSHSAGIGSVVKLCELLLHDSDACPSELESTALNKAMRSLDRRWKTICTLCSARKNKIEDTWRLWQKLVDELTKFESWLAMTETEIEGPSYCGLSVAMIRQEMKRYESYQSHIHAQLSPLERINKQYRRLARESRTDQAGELRDRVFGANNRWDDLSRYIHAILRRMRHTLKVRDCFVETRENLLAWLADVDARLDLVDKLPDINTTEKIRRVRAVQQEVRNYSSRLGFIEEAGLYLMQKLDPLDTPTVEAEVTEFDEALEELLAKLDIYAERVGRMEQHSPGKSKLALNQSAIDTSDGEELTAPYRTVPLTSGVSLDMISPSRGSLRSSPTRGGSLNAGSSPERSGRRSPRSKRPRSHHADRGAPEAPGVSPGGAKEPISDVMEPEPLDERMDRTRVGPVEAGLPDLPSLDQRLGAGDPELQARLHPDPKFQLYPSSEPQLSSDPLRSSPRSKHGLQGPENDGEPLTEDRLQGLFRQWERELPPSARDDPNHRQQWLQFTQDMANLLLWLQEAEAMQRSQSSISTDIHQLEHDIKRHKEFLVQLDNKKAIVMSINLCAKRYLAPGDEDYLSRGDEDGENLAGNLDVMNRRWELVCSRAANWQNRLQLALIDSDDFHQTVYDLLAWLKSTEERIKELEPVHLKDDKAVLQDKYTRFVELKSELERSQPRVVALMETADQLVTNSQSDPSASTSRDKLHCVNDQLRLMLRVCLAYIARLHRVLGYDAASFPHIDETLVHGSMAPLHQTLAGTLDLDLDRAAPLMLDSETDMGESPHRRYLSRVFRAALPLQMLMLVLLGISCLVPMSRDDYSCILRNNLRQSFDPMLQWPHGPPPF